MGLPKDNMFFGMRHLLVNEQWTYINSIYGYKITVVDAPAGTGKTFIPVALSKIMGRELIYIHPAVAEDKLGYSAGSAEEKVKKYHAPLYNALSTIGIKDPASVIYSTDPMLKDQQKNCWVHAYSDAYLRGATLKGNYLVLIDETQNFKYDDLRKILTRIDDSVIVVMVGHRGQCDLPKPKESGFVPYLNFYRTRPYANIVSLKENHRGIIASEADMSYEELMSYSKEETE